MPCYEDPQASIRAQPMWVFLNNSFLSIVAHRDKPDVLLVRARKAGDIEAVFPGATTWQDPRADYRHRAEIARSDVAGALAKAAAGIDYANFKNSVEDLDRHEAYMRVWGVMARMQEK